MAAGFPTPECAFFPIGRGNMVDMTAFAVGAARLPSDPVGAFTLNLTNLVVGSALQIESTLGVPFFNGVVAGATESVVLSAYASGNPLNSLRIKVRKGSASPYFQPWETQTLAAPGTQTIFVSQIPDE